MADIFAVGCSRAPMILNTPEDGAACGAAASRLLQSHGFGSEEQT
jgi:hypothetical protein